MVTVESNGDSLKIRNNVAKTLEENGYIIKGQGCSLYHPASGYTMVGVRFFAASLEEDGVPIAAGASFTDFLTHEKTLCGKA